MCITKADSGASTHLWQEENKDTQSNIHTECSPLVKLPYSTTINDNKVEYIPLSEHLTKVAKKVRILKDLTSAN